MIIAVDIGGTKTLIASVNTKDKVTNKEKFPSPKKYSDFIELLSNKINVMSDGEKISILSVGCAGSIDRQHGVITNSPNLHWLNRPLAADLQKNINCQKLILENDANLAGLSEAHGLKKLEQKVLYITFSTGVGTGFIDNGVLVPELLDAEGGHMLFEHEGKLLDWESFAAGRAIVGKYGKMASELNNSKAWEEIAKNMAIGIVDNCAVFPADTVVIGGGVGTYFYKYAQPLKKAIREMIKKSIMIKLPVVVGAKNAEEAVILGCIILARQYEQHRQSTTTN